MHRTLPWVLLVLGPGAVSLGCKTPERLEITPPDAWAQPSFGFPHQDIQGAESPDGPTNLFGASILVREFGSPCRLEVSWHVGNGSGRELTVVLVIHRQTVFPLPERMINLGACLPAGPDSTGRVFSEYANLNINVPEYFDWVAPKRGDIYIPVGGEAILDHRFHATAVLGEREDASDRGVSATVTITSRDAPDVVNYDLRSGDAFDLGKARATVVRVVEPIARAVGWVEVALSTDDAKHTSARSKP
jgi:hypothetical protein